MLGLPPSLVGAGLRQIVPPSSPRQSVVMIASTLDASTQPLLCPARPK
jgi:hypothetical protein